MKVDVYERIWMWGAAGLLAVFVSALLFSAGAHAVHPPSHVETIDPTTARDSGEFSQPQVTATADGARVVALARIYSFEPGEIRVPAGKPITFRITSPDVIHGFQIIGTNANVMVIPGYVSQFTVTLPWPGEYLIVCNEYCGLGHHTMQGKLIVEEVG